MASITLRSQTNADLAADSTTLITSLQREFVAAEVTPTVCRPGSANYAQLTSHSSSSPEFETFACDTYAQSSNIEYVVVFLNKLANKNATHSSTAKKS
ncbi:hypothetical protein CEXT_68831 [Caerostris extrusa]|uniref:Uncharacterized protein n=1 Tax=Caerostris extrusa TaxID=172846 RepID=A0AAV4VDV9_CAEEX|nr:hypothetical protein CEXT_68831 [Caerostris extrusa]